jgi:serine/threonine-protein kinase
MLFGWTIRRNRDRDGAYEKQNPVLISLLPDRSPNSRRLQNTALEDCRNKAYDIDTDLEFSKTLQERYTNTASSDMELSIYPLVEMELSEEGMNALSHARMLQFYAANKFASRWELKQIIGAGGAGVVVSAFDQRLREKVAIKVVLPEKGQRFTLNEAKRLSREGQAMKRVHHASIVKLHEYLMDEKNEFCLFVMEFASGVSLQDVLRSRGTFTQARMIEIAKNLLGALNEIHRKNIIHLDIKPSNVMYVENDGLWSVKIIDFGLARAPCTGSDKVGELTTMMTTGGAIEGTARFMPPEQLEGKMLDFRSDIFGIGVTLYQLACGQCPHRCSNQTSSHAAMLRELDSWKDTPPLLLHERNPGITQSFSHFVAQAIALEPAERYKDAEDMLDALERLQKTVFISWRMNECKKEVKQLQPALEALGIRTIVVKVAPGGDLLRAVKTGMHDAQMFIIMGTKGYGTKTSGKIDTWVEMHDIKESGKPCFLINMNPEKSLKRFKVGKTNELFDLDTVSWHRWAVSEAMDGKLPQQIMQKLEQLKHVPQLLLPESGDIVF